MFAGTIIVKFCFFLDTSTTRKQKIKTESEKYKYNRSMYVIIMVYCVVSAEK
jgi:hypothetical protein